MSASVRRRTSYAIAPGASASWALGLSGFFILVQFAFFLLLGVGIAAFYSPNEAAGTPQNSDEAVMLFVVQHMGAGLKGLILAAVLAATM